MTIDSIYQPVITNVNPSRTYSFAFQSVGPDAIIVTRLDAAGNEYSVSSGDYTLMMIGSTPVYDGGTIVFAAAPVAGTVQYKISRYTPRDQTVDYQPYTSFPAETHEFALDKLTMITQETGFQFIEGDPGGDLDPNAYIPISGTRVGVPLTGTLQHTSQNQNYRQGILGAGFDGYYIADLKQDGNAQFVVSMNNLYTAFTSTGEVRLSTVYDGSEDPSAAATVQYVIDAIGGPGAAFIPLAGTAIGEEVTGDIQFKNVTLGVTGNFGILEGVTDVMTLYSDDSVLIATGANVTTQWFGFGTNGQLNLPDIDYSLVDDLDAVNKAYVDAAVAGGGTANLYLPLAGTDPSYPVTGTIEFEDIPLNRAFIMGISNLPGFDDGFTIASQGSSGSPSNIYFVSSGTVYAFTPDALVMPKGVVSTTTTDPGTYDFLVDGDLGVSAGIVCSGLLNNSGAAFGGNVQIDTKLGVGGAVNASYTLTVFGDASIGGGLTVTSIAAGGILNAGNISTDTLSFSAAQLNLGNAATRKDYVDGLNATNIKTSGNQVKSGVLNMTSSQGLALQGLAGGSNQLLGVGATAFGSFVYAAGPATLLDDVPTLRQEVNTAREKLDNMRAAFDGIADILNATNPQKAQIATLLDSLGIV